jgi:hypothetical protein
VFTQPLFYLQEIIYILTLSSARQLLVEDADHSVGVGMMVEQEENLRRGPFVNSTGGDPATRTVPIITPVIQTSAPSPGDPMDVTSPTIAPMGPPVRTSPESETNGTRNHTGIPDEQSNASNMLGPNAAVAAQAGAQQPKVVQTAFIHKLYKSVSRVVFGEMAELTVI